MSMRLRAIIGLLAWSAGATVVWAAPFTQGNLVVSRVGGVNDDLLNTPDTAARVRLEEISPLDGSIVQTVNLPALASDVAGTNNHRLTLGSDFRAGMLHRSVNGLFLAIGGYDAEARNGATPGTPLYSLVSPKVIIPAQQMNRVVGRIDNSGIADTSTAVANVTGQSGLYEGTQGSFRSVATVDGSGFWLSGNHNGGGSSRQGRVQYVPYQGTQSVHVPTGPGGGGEFVDARVVNIFNGQLYGVWNITHTDDLQFQGLYSIGTGLPTSSGSNTVNVPNVYSITGVINISSPYDFFFFDADTVYLCDDDIPGGTGGILKFVRDTVPESPTFGALTFRYKLIAGLVGNHQAVRTLTGQSDGNGHVILYAITASSIASGGDLGNSLVTVTDTGCPTGAEPGCTAADTFTTLTAAGDLEVFRGVAFAPRACEGDECNGACCLPLHGCSQMTESACTAARGLFRGFQTTCATSVCPLVCHAPAADADGDGDVDMDDFAQFQLCYTGTSSELPNPDCKCFDRPEEGFPAGDGTVGQYDFNQFIACASGPFVPADPDCGNPAP